MRKELYSAICDSILAMPDGEVRHVDLWNHNVEYLDQESPWERPAVFVEFMPVDWRPIKADNEYQANALVKLHIVTDWAGSSAAGAPTQSDALDAFSLSEKIQGAIKGVTDGNSYWYRDILQTATNHNHEEIVENIDTYQFKVIRRVN